MEQGVEKLILESIEFLRKELNELGEQVAVLGSYNTLHKDDFNKVKESLENVRASVELLKFNANKIGDTPCALVEELKKDAFPDGDVRGHKEFHEKEMVLLKDRATMKKEVMTHAIKGIFWASVVGIFWAVVYAVKGWLNDR